MEAKLLMAIEFPSWSLGTRSKTTILKTKRLKTKRLKAAICEKNDEDKMIKPTSRRAKELYLRRYFVNILF